MPKSDRLEHMEMHSGEECDEVVADPDQDSTAVHQTGGKRWMQETLGQLQQNWGQGNDSHLQERQGLEAAGSACVVPRSCACERRSLHCYPREVEDSVLVGQHPQVEVEDSLGSVRLGLAVCSPEV